jgi:hypothetical protein
VGVLRVLMTQLVLVDREDVAVRVEHEVANFMRDAEAQSPV